MLLLDKVNPVTEPLLHFISCHEQWEELDEVVQWLRNSGFSRYSFIFSKVARSWSCNWDWDWVFAWLKSKNKITREWNNNLRHGGVNNSIWVIQFCFLFPGLKCVCMRELKRKEANLLERMKMMISWFNLWFETLKFKAWFYQTEKLRIVGFLINVKIQFWRVRKSKLIYTLEQNSEKYKYYKLRNQNFYVGRNTSVNWRNNSGYWPPFIVNIERMDVSSAICTWCLFFFYYRN